MGYTNECDDSEQPEESCASHMPSRHNPWCDERLAVKKPSMRERPGFHS